MAKKKTRSARAVAKSLGLDYLPAADCYVVPRRMMEGLLDLIKNLDSRVPRGDRVTRGKNTYCCKVPADGPIEDCNQFRAYSYEAPAVCLRWAIRNGYSSGSLSRGECGDECP